jgi:hypothetical protein
MHASWEVLNRAQRSTSLLITEFMEYLSFFIRIKKVQLFDLDVEYCTWLNSTCLLSLTYRSHILLIPTASYHQMEVPILSNTLLSPFAFGASVMRLYSITPYYGPYPRPSLITCEQHGEVWSLIVEALPNSWISRNVLVLHLNICQGVRVIIRWYEISACNFWGRRLALYQLLIRLLNEVILDCRLTLLHRRRESKERVERPLEYRSTFSSPFLSTRLFSFPTPFPFQPSNPSNIASSTKPH